MEYVVHYGNGDLRRQFRFRFARGWEQAGGGDKVGEPLGATIIGTPLARGEGLADALVAHTADIILVLSADHVCRFANPAVQNRLGYAPAEVLGLDVSSLHHPDDLPRAAAMLAAVAADPGQPAQCEARLRHRDGTWRWMAVVATNRLDDPAVRGIVCTLHDVTDRMEAIISAEAALRAAASR